MSQQVLTFAGSPLSGAALVAALEAKLQSLASNRSGTARPSDIQTGEVWLDTTTATAQALKLYDGTQDIIFGYFNSTAHTFTPAVGLFNAAAATGTVNAITATYTPAITLADKTICSLYCAGANTSTAPTFAPNGLTARPITKLGGQALAAGDIPRAGFVALLQYDLASTRWELLNPATSTIPSSYVQNNVAQGYTRQQYAVPVVLTAQSGSIAVDADLHQDLDISATGAITLANPTNPVRGKTIFLTLYAASALAITWGANYYSNADATLPTAFVAGKKIYLSLRCVDGSDWVLIGLVRGA